MIAARVEALDGVIVAFKAAMILPRGQIVSRSTLLKEIDTDTAGLMEQIVDLDDLVLQFDGSAEGRRFIEAWKKARIIVDRVATMTPKPAASGKPAAAGAAQQTPLSRLSVSPFAFAKRAGGVLWVGQGSPAVGPSGLPDIRLETAYRLRDKRRHEIRCRREKNDSRTVHGGWSDRSPICRNHAH